MYALVGMEYNTQEVYILAKKCQWMVFCKSTNYMYLIPVFWLLYALISRNRILWTSGVYFNFNTPPQKKKWKKKEKR